ncbi:oligoendopeptidase F [Neofamilia massiliensis]|uniref:oligoendopeptidase F n=1 Tax=Neofamilia massiliensis TaxID=1673724 RepID=UPI0006BB8654|nr:oligoendopeptidase F [Neofamilia massiliensis]
MDKYNWDLSKMYKDENAFNESYETLAADVKKIKSLTEDYGKNFKEFFPLTMKTARGLDNLATFAHMKFDENTKNSSGQKMQMKAFSLYDDFETAIAGFKPYLLTLSEDEIASLIKENKLEDYEIYFSRILRYKDHTLSAEEEKAIGSLSFLAGAPGEAYTLLRNADMEFPTLETTGEKLTEANYIPHLLNKDVKVRKEAFEKYYKTLRGAENTIASLQFNNVKGLTTMAELKKFDSARQMELYEDNVDVGVYDTLIKVIHDYLPVLHKYYKIKKEYMGLEDQHMYDVYLPMISNFDKKIPYEEAKETILEALKPLGDEYISILKEGFESNWIDVYPKDGKRSGAYSSGSYDSEPYILMNYNENLDSMFTLAHELGHSMHSYFSKKNNVFINSSYTIFVAEVASTTNELLLLNYLIDKAESEEEKLYLVNHYVDSFKSTVFRQTMFAEFEKKTHEAVERGEVLTAENFNEIYYDLNKEYYGDAVISDKDIEFEWARIPHFYRNFYVYKYATGFSTAVSLSENILSGDKDKLEAYLNFLKDGGRNFPLDQLRAAGADISKEETLVKAMKVFEAQVNELEKLL